MRIGFNIFSLTSRTNLCLIFLFMINEVKIILSYLMYVHILTSIIFVVIDIYNCNVYCGISTKKS